MTRSMSWVHQLILSLPLCIVAFSLCGCSNEQDPAILKTDSPNAAWQEGNAEADRDIKAGVLRIKIYGLADPPGDDKYQRLLKDRLGVELDRVAHCCVTEDQVQSVRGYNERMTAVIEQRFGQGTLARIKKEAYGW
jgi:hypothetical protein